MEAIPVRAERHWQYWRASRVPHVFAIITVLCAVRNVSSSPVLPLLFLQSQHQQVQQPEPLQTATPQKWVVLVCVCVALLMPMLLSDDDGIFV